MTHWRIIDSYKPTDAHMHRSQRRIFPSDVGGGGIGELDALNAKWNQFNARLGITAVSQQRAIGETRGRFIIRLMQQSGGGQARQGISTHALGGPRHLPRAEQAAAESDRQCGARPAPIASSRCVISSGPFHKQRPAGSDRKRPGQRTIVTTPLPTGITSYSDIAYVKPNYRVVEHLIDSTRSQSKHAHKANYWHMMTYSCGPPIAPSRII